MNVWQELGIAPTAEVREIRRAYAQRLRHTHPEDDPDGFQRLRAAYESALAATASVAGDGVAPVLPPLPGETLRSVSVGEEVLAEEVTPRAVDVVDASCAADPPDRLVVGEGERHRAETVWQEETGEPLYSPHENNDGQSDTSRQEAEYQPEGHTEQEEVNELSQRLLEALQAGREPEALTCLAQLVVHPHLLHLEYRWQYEGWLLSHPDVACRQTSAGFYAGGESFVWLDSPAPGAGSSAACLSRHAAHRPGPLRPDHGAPGRGAGLALQAAP